MALHHPFGFPTLEPAYIIKVKLAISYCTVCRLLSLISAKAMTLVSDDYEPPALVIEIYFCCEEGWTNWLYIKSRID